MFACQIVSLYHHISFFHTHLENAIRPLCQQHQNKICFHRFQTGIFDRNRGINSFWVGKNPRGDFWTFVPPPFEKKTRSSCKRHGWKLITGPSSGTWLNGGFPPISHPKGWSFLVGKTHGVGETHHFRKRPYGWKTIIFFFLLGDMAPEPSRCELC